MLGEILDGLNKPLGLGISCFHLSKVVVVVAVYFILSRLLYLAFSANLGLLCMPHPRMRPLV